MLLIMEVGVWRDVEVVVVGDVVARGLFARALVWGDVCQSPRGPKLTAAAQAAAELLPHEFLYSCSLLSQGLSAETKVQSNGPMSCVAVTVVNYRVGITRWGVLVTVVVS
jgi:hypothetical protein